MANDLAYQMTEIMFINLKVSGSEDFTYELKTKKESSISIADSFFSVSKKLIF